MSEEAPFRLRRAEAVLRERTSRIVLVMERPWNDENVQAVLRTAEAFGVQHIWTIKHPHMRVRAIRSVTKGSHLWITRRGFTSVTDCVAAIREEGLELWATDLAPGADEIAVASDLAPIPKRFALVIGRELQGVSEEILSAADRRVYLPMHGFTESFNLSVATALLLQRIFDADPTLRGAMAKEERGELRRQWFQRLAGSNEARQKEFLRWADQPPEPHASTRPLEASRQPRIKKGFIKDPGF